MDKLSQLIENYRGKGVSIGSGFIIYKNYCSNFVIDCSDLRLAIIGAEGFILHENSKREPVMDEIADFSSISESSWQKYVDRCTRSATLFFEEMIKSGKSDGYEFVVLNPPNER